MRPTLNTLQNEQLRLYVDAVIETRKLVDNPPEDVDAELRGCVPRRAGSQGQPPRGG